jgi:hypothetical protein
MSRRIFRIAVVAVIAAAFAACSNPVSPSGPVVKDGTVAPNI